MERGLPGDWTETNCSSTGRAFYVSVLHDRCQWDRPGFSIPPPLPRLPQGVAVDVEDVEAAAPDGGLPGDWVWTRFDLGDGNWRPGYASYNLGASQWEKPTRADAPPMIQLPQGWRREWSSDDRVYYACDGAGRTQWDLPTCADLPPLPRAGSQGYDYERPSGPPPPISEPEDGPPGDWVATRFQVDGRWYWGWSSLRLNAAQWPRPRYEDGPPTLRREPPPPPDEAPPEEEPDEDPAPPQDPGHDPDEHDDDKRVRVSNTCVRHLCSYP